MVMLRPLKKLEVRTEAILINTSPDEDLSSSRVSSVKVTYAGFDGESHSGLVRASCVRVRGQYAEGTEIRNTRQISIVSIEELALIADAMGIDGLQPEPQERCQQQERERVGQCEVLAHCRTSSTVELSNRPAVFIIDKAGILRYARRAKTYADRPKPAEIVRELKSQS